MNAPHVPGGLLRLMVLTLATVAGPPSLPAAENPPPFIFIKSRVLDLTDDGEKVVMRPRLTLSEGIEGSIELAGDGEGMTFGMLPKIQYGKIHLIGNFAQHERADGKPVRQGDLPVTRSLPPGQVPPPPNQAARTAESQPNPDLDFPRNYRMHGFVRLPGKVPRINLENVSTGKKFWIELGDSTDGIRFASVDYARERPVAILARGEEFARVSLDSPVLEPYAPPVELKTTRFQYEDILEPGQVYRFHAGTNKFGQPRQIEILAELTDGTEIPKD